MPSKFNVDSQDLSIADLLHDFYTVPDFQREYVWTEDDVEKLLQDIIDDLLGDEKAVVPQSEYFLGSIVVVQDGPSSNVYQLIDGQQRMTTIYITLCAARHLQEEWKQEPSDGPTPVLLGQIAAPEIDEHGNATESRTRVTLQYDENSEVLQQLAMARTTPDLSRFQPTKSTKGIVKAYEKSHQMLSECGGRDPSVIKRFLAGLTKNVTLIRIETPSINNALKVFETINDRGVGLNPLDLLKNRLFMNVSDSKHAELKRIWKHMVDTLDGCGEKPLRFLRYYVLSQFDTDHNKPIRETEIYDWFTDSGKRDIVDRDPITFARRLLSSAQTHAHFLDARNTSGAENYYLQNIQFLGKTLRQQWILLLAGSELSGEQFNTLCQWVEKLLFCGLIIGVPARKLETKFTQWAKLLRKQTDHIGFEKFLQDTIISELQNYARRFEEAFQTLHQSTLQRNRLRYILAKITQYVDDNAYGGNATKRLDTYIDKTIHVEHILPRNPPPELRRSFDQVHEYNEYVGKLGNLTLLEGAIDSSISNKSFDAKRVEYAKSKLLLTKSIAVKPQIGNTQIDRAVLPLSQFEQWNSDAILQRQTLLTQLAKKIWLPT